MRRMKALRMIQIRQPQQEAARQKTGQDAARQEAGQAAVQQKASQDAAQQEADALRANKNSIAKQIGALMAQGKKDEAEEIKKQVAETSARLKELEAIEPELKEKVKKIMDIVLELFEKVR